MLSEKSDFQFLNGFIKKLPANNILANHAHLFPVQKDGMLNFTVSERTVGYIIHFHPERKAEFISAWSGTI